MRVGTGFTLLEVVVAACVLTVGILGLLTLQAKSLQVQQRVRLIRELVNVAEAELDWRLAQASPGSSACRPQATSASFIRSCTSVTERCTAGGGPCGSGPSAAEAVRVRVVVEGVHDGSFELSALHAPFGGW